MVGVFGWDGCRSRFCVVRAKQGGGDDIVSGCRKYDRASWLGVTQPITHIWRSETLCKNLLKIILLCAWEIRHVTTTS